MWAYLRDRRLAGLKFRRRHPLGRFVVDFVCLELKLIVELDGGQHMDETRYDAARTRWLYTQGYCVVRYWNDDVLMRCHAVLDDLLMHLSVRVIKSPHPPFTPRAGRGK